MLEKIRKKNKGKKWIEEKKIKQRKENEMGTEYKQMQGEE